MKICELNFRKMREDASKAGNKKNFYRDYRLVFLVRQYKMTVMWFMCDGNLYQEVVFFLITPKKYVIM